jgi:hypothetical protein
MGWRERKTDRKLKGKMKIFGNFQERHIDKEGRLCDTKAHLLGNI